MAKRKTCNKENRSVNQLFAALICFVCLLVFPVIAQASCTTKVKGILGQLSGTAGVSDLGTTLNMGTDLMGMTQSDMSGKLDELIPQLEQIDPNKMVEQLNNLGGFLQNPNFETAGVLGGSISNLLGGGALPNFDNKLRDLYEKIADKHASEDDPAKKQKLLNAMNKISGIISTWPAVTNAVDNAQNALSGIISQSGILDEVNKAQDLLGLAMDPSSIGSDLTGLLGQIGSLDMGKLGDIKDKLDSICGFLPEGGIKDMLTGVVGALTNGVLSNALDSLKGWAKDLLGGLLDKLPDGALKNAAQGALDKLNTGDLGGALGSLQNSGINGALGNLGGITGLLGGEGGGLGNLGGNLGGSLGGSLGGGLGGSLGGGGIGLSTNNLAGLRCIRPYKSEKFDCPRIECDPDVGLKGTNSGSNDFVKRVEAYFKYKPPANNRTVYLDKAHHDYEINKPDERTRPSASRTGSSGGGGLQDLLNGLKDQIKNGITSMLQGMANDLLNGLKDKITNMLSSALQGVTSGIANGITNQVSNLASQAGVSIPQSQLDGLNSSIQNGLSNLVTSVVQNGTIPQGEVNVTLSGIQTQVTALLNQNGVNVSSAQVDGILSGINGDLSGLLNQASGLLPQGELDNLLSGVGGQLGGLLGQAQSSGIMPGELDSVMGGLNGDLSGLLGQSGLTLPQGELDNLLGDLNGELNGLMGQAGGWAQGQLDNVLGDFGSQLDGLLAQGETLAQDQLDNLLGNLSGQLDNLLGQTGLNISPDQLNGLMGGVGNLVGGFLGLGSSCGSTILGLGIGGDFKGDVNEKCQDNRWRDMCLIGDLRLDNNYELNKRALMGDEEPLAGVGGVAPVYNKTSTKLNCLVPKNTARKSPLEFDNGWRYRDQCPGSQKLRRVQNDKVETALDIFRGEYGCMVPLPNCHVKNDWKLDSIEWKNKEYGKYLDAFGSSIGNALGGALGGGALGSIGSTLGNLAGNLFGGGSYESKLKNILSSDQFKEVKELMDPTISPAAECKPAHWVRLMLDSCANQYILQKSMNPDYVFNPDRRKTGYSPRLCQPFKAVPIDAGEEEYKVSDYLKRSYTGLLKDNYMPWIQYDRHEGKFQTDSRKFRDDEWPERRIKWDPKTWNNPSENKFSTAYNKINSGVSINDYASHPVERIIDPLHPFSPRYDIAEDMDGALITDRSLFEGRGESKSRLVLARIQGLVQGLQKYWCVPKKGKWKNRGYWEFGCTTYCSAVEVDLLRFRYKDYRLCMGCQIDTNEKAFWDEYHKSRKYYRWNYCWFNLGEVLGELTDKISDVVDQVKTAVGQVADQVNNTLGQIQGKIDELAKKTGMEDKLGPITGKLSGVLDKISGKVNSGSSDLTGELDELTQLNGELDNLMAQSGSDNSEEQEGCEYGDEICGKCPKMVLYIAKCAASCIVGCVQDLCEKAAKYTEACTKCGVGAKAEALERTRKRTNYTPKKKNKLDEWSPTSVGDNWPVCSTRFDHKGDPELCNKAKEEFSCDKQGEKAEDDPNIAVESKAAAEQCKTKTLEEICHDAAKPVYSVNFLKIRTRKGDFRTGDTKPSVGSTLGGLGDVLGGVTGGIDGITSGIGSVTGGGGIDGITSGLGSIGDGLTGVATGVGTAATGLGSLTGITGNFKDKVDDWRKDYADEDPAAGYGFREHFGNRRPYMRWWDTGKEAFQVKDKPDYWCDWGQNDTIMGIGRDYNSIHGRKSQLCRYGGSGGIGDSCFTMQKWMAGDGVPNNRKFPSLAGSEWAELKMYQANCFRTEGFNCLCQYEKVFKPLSSEEAAHAMMGAMPDIPVVTASGAPGMAGAAAVRQALNLIKQHWALSWRGYASTLADRDSTVTSPAIGKNQQFPYLFGTPAPGSIITGGLDKAQAGDIVIWPQGSGSLPYLGVVTATNNINDHGSLAKVANQKRWVRIKDANNGKYPDACGNTSFLGRGPVRTFYPNKDEMPEALQNLIKEQITSTYYCDDPELGHCVSRRWNTLTLYRPGADDDREGK